MSGNAMGTNFTEFTGTALSVRTELTSSWPMLWVTLTAIFLFLSSLTVLDTRVGQDHDVLVVRLHDRTWREDPEVGGLFQAGRCGSALARM